MKKSLLLIVLCLLSASLNAAIIFLNGTSSAGKSSIAAQLQKELDDAYTVVSIDDFMLESLTKEIRKLKIIDKKTNPKSIWEVRYYVDQLPEDQSKDIHAYLKEFNSDSARRMYNHIVRLAKNGENVIVDHVLTHDHDILNCMQRLNRFDTAFVLVYCPLDVLPKRVEARNNSGIVKEKRKLDCVFSLFSYIYAPCDKGDHLDTLYLKDFKYLIDSVKDNFIKVEKFSRFKDLMYNRLKFSNADTVHIKPKLSYDLIVDSGSKSPEDCAKQIKDFMRKNKEYNAVSKNLEAIRTSINSYVCVDLVEDYDLKEAKSLLDRSNYLEFRRLADFEDLSDDANDDDIVFAIGRNYRDKLVGVIAGQEYDEDIITITKLALVNPKGKPDLFSKLLEPLLYEFPDCKALQVIVDSRNKKGIKLFKDLGFQEIDSIDQLVGSRFVEHIIFEKVI